MSSPPTYTLRVEGMMCQKNCATTVQSAILSVPGVLSCEVSYPKAEALVWGEKASAAEIITSIEDVGYGAELDIPTYHFKIEGMMCQKNCARTVREAIVSVSGVEKAEVSYPQAQALVWGAKASPSEIINVIEDVGYGAELDVNTNSNTQLRTGNENLVSDTDGNSQQADIVLTVKGMFDAVACPQKIRETLLAVDGVFSAEVSFDSRSCSVWGFADAGAVIDALAQAGYSSSPLDSNLSPHTAQAMMMRNSSAVGGSGVTSPGSGKTPSSRVQDNVIYIGLKELRKVTSNTERAINNMKKIDGVKFVDCDRKAGYMSVHYENSVSRANIESALSSLRYSVAIIDDPLSSSSATSGKFGVAGDSGKTELSKSREVVFDVTGMSCANCALKIEKALFKMVGVKNPSVSSMTNKAKLYLNETLSNAVGPRDIREAIVKLGYGCTLVKSNKPKVGKDGEIQLSCQGELDEWAQLAWIAFGFGVPVALLHLINLTSPDFRHYSTTHAVCSGGVSLTQVLMLLLNMPILIIVGFRFYRGAVIGARHCNFGMDFLIMTGTSITFLYSIGQISLACSTGEATNHMFFEAVGMLLMFVTGGKYIEAYAKGRSCSAIANLLKLQPNEAHLVLQPESTHNAASTQTTAHSTATSGIKLGSGAEITKTISLELVQRGDLLKVFPGDRIPTDGHVESGSSFVDEAMITGESQPVLKGKGDLVFGSTVNQNSVLYIRVTSLGSESALAQIVSLVENAQMNKAPVQAYADQLAGIFTPVILILASVTFLTWCLLCLNKVVPEAWFADEYDDPYLFSMLFAISVVVISCPCALGLATPTAIMVGTSVGAGHGILIKGGTAFETAHRVDTLIFDKTGTLTVGKPHVTDELVFRDVSPAAASAVAVGNASTAGVLSNGGMGDPVKNAQSAKNAILRLVATAEQCSDHPIARALREAAEDRGIVLAPLPSSDNAHSGDGDGSGAAVYSVGGGISVTLAEGALLVGNRAFMEEHAVHITSEVDNAMWGLEIQGKTAICAALDGAVCGVLGIADMAKPEAFSAIKALHAMNIDVWMVTGDNRTTAEALAEELGIPKDRVMAGVLPKDKVGKVEELQADGKYVAMVGDGINDSPALAEAKLGVAIGAGTEVAIEAADMVLIRSDLHDLVVALDLAKVVFARIKMNFIWAMIYNLAAVPYAAGVWYPWTHMMLPPQYAGMAMALSSVSVVCSSMALWWYRRPKDLMKAKSVRDALKGGSMLDKTTNKILAIKDKIADGMGGGVEMMRLGGNSPSGPAYTQLPSDEQLGACEAGQSLGMDLGITGGASAIVQRAGNGSGTRSIEQSHTADPGSIVV